MTKTTKTLKTKAAADTGAATTAASDAETPLAAPVADPEPTPPKSKIQVVIALLRRPEGARIEELMATTGWQAHSVRGAMSGAIKKKLGLTIASEKAGGVRTYRIAEPAA